MNIRDARPSSKSVQIIGLSDCIKPNCNSYDQQGSNNRSDHFDSEMKLLQKEMASIQLDCDALVDRYGSPSSPYKTVPTEDKSTQLNESDLASVFSCESCEACCRTLIESRNAAVAMKNIFLQNRRNGSVSPETVSTDGMNGGTGVVNCSLSANVRKLKPKDSPENSPRKTLSNGQSEKDRTCINFYPCSPTMYTNEANLQHTIWLQQQLLRQALSQQQQKSASPKTSNQAQVSKFTITPYATSDVIVKKDIQSNCTSSLNATCDTSTSSPFKSVLANKLTCRDGSDSNGRTRSEWKVKRRPDGTRYITQKKSARNKILKKRALKITEERCSGLTTDDDTMSELKFGRYWSKDERKKHFEMAKDRRKKEMIMRATRMAVLREQSEEREIDSVCDGGSGGNGASGSLGRTRDTSKGKLKTAEAFSLNIRHFFIRTNGNGSANDSRSSGSKQSSPVPNGLLSVTTV